MLLFKCNLSLKFVFFLFIVLVCIQGKIPDKVLCKDIKCSEPVSKGRTLLGYASPDKNILSFKKNEVITIYSKSVGSDPVLFGVEIKGVRGFVPKTHVKEFHVFSKAEILVDVENLSDSPKKEVPSKQTEKFVLQPDNVKQPYEFIDGTQIPLELGDSYNNLVNDSEKILVESKSNENVEDNNSINSVQETKISEDREEDEENESDEEEEDEEEEEEGENVIEEEENDKNEDQKKSEKLTENKPEETKNLLESIEGMLSNTVDFLFQNEDNEHGDEKTKSSQNVGSSIQSGENSYEKEKLEERNPENDETTNNFTIDNPNLKIDSSDKDINVETANISDTPALPIPEKLSGQNTENEINNLQEVNKKNDDIIQKLTENKEFNDQAELKNLEEENNSFNFSTDDGNESLEDLKIDTTVTPPVQNKMENPLRVEENVTSTIPSEILENTTEKAEDSDSKFENFKDSVTTVSPDFSVQLNEDSSDPLTNLENKSALENAVNSINNFEIKSESSSDFYDVKKFEIKPDIDYQLNNDKNIENEVKNINNIYETLEKSSKIIYENKGNDVNEKSVTSESTSLPTSDQENNYCFASDNNEDCALETTLKKSESENSFHQTIMDFMFSISNEVIITVLITALTTVVLLLGYFHIDKSSRIRPLIGKINQLEKNLMFSEEENKEINAKLSEMETRSDNQIDASSNELVKSLKEELEIVQSTKISLEEQISILEKELENSTEVGLELNRMLSDFLSSQNSETFVANIEQLQRQLVEQQSTINNYTETLNVKETEIHEIRLELDISNRKVIDLQEENDKSTASLLKAEEEKFELEKEINVLKKHIQQLTISSTAQINKLSEELQHIQKKAEDNQKIAELKTKEFDFLKENILKMKNLKGEDLNTVLDAGAFKAELDLLKTDKDRLLEHFQQSENMRTSLEQQYQTVMTEMQNLKLKFGEADKAKLEAQTKLEVLENYFKERESQLQKELSKHEALFMEKQGETYSITEKIKFMQEELQNYKAQNESLKQEIMEQEVQMKSKISLLEKEVHENWMNARQIERKLEESKQEAAQLRNRLTLRERSYHEEKYQNQSNGELPVSPTPASPPLLFNSRDITTSPPLRGLPPPFLPLPFMPPPHGSVPSFIPPPSSMPPLPHMYPTDRRPAPLGRMSSPPINSRYSPDSRPYSPYSRNSPSPTSDDEYARSPPPMHRGFNPINSRDMKREYRRSPGPHKNSRNKNSLHSSGSENSNDSDKVSRKAKHNV